MVDRESRFSEENWLTLDYKSLQIKKTNVLN